ncbi:MAG: hypothetical protein ACRDRH_01850 [Pseudonocardia sp.]
MTENDERGDRPSGAPGGPPEQIGGEQGRMRYQDESTTPREPSVAERRAREQAARREREAEEQRLVTEAASRKKRKRILIGAGVTVGVVALIAVGYSVAQPDEVVEARCVGPDDVVVDDSNCVTPAASSGGYYGGGGFFPIFIGGGGRQYHYNYGGGGAIGQQATGGTTVVPKDGARVTTPSGKSISRGGLGVSAGGSSSGS